MYIVYNRFCWMNLWTHIFCKTDKQNNWLLHCHVCKQLLYLDTFGVSTLMSMFSQYLLCFQCLFCFALHKTQGTRRFYRSSSHIKQRFKRNLWNKPETCLNRTWNKPETCLNRTWNKPETCLNRTWNKPETCLNRTWNKPETCLNSLGQFSAICGP
jgi:hypothetical protein